MLTLLMILRGGAHRLLACALVLLALTMSAHAAPPTVTNVSPNNGSTAGGTSVTITGTGFAGATDLSFGGTRVSPFFVLFDTQITATTPAHSAGAVDVIVTGADRTSGTLTGGFTYTAPTITLSPPSGALPGATVGTSYSQTITASGGSGPYTFASTGTLPSGLTFATDGTLTGTPTGDGTFNFTVTATDNSGSPGPYTGSSSYSLTVVNPPSNNAALSNLTLSAGTLNPGFNSGTTSYTASVPNSVSSLTVTPTVAEGTASVRVNGATTASGTPPGAIPLAVGSNTITVVVTAGDGTTTRNYTVTVTRAAPPPPPTITLSPPSGALPGATVGTPYSQTITASGGNAPYSFALTGGTLPNGLTFKVDGTLTGTPTSSGTFNFTVTATDSSNPGFYSGSSSYSLTVASRPSNNAALFNLTLSAGTLNPSFNSGTTSYTASVPNSVASLTVTPTVAESTASVRVNGALTTSGMPSAPIPLAVGANTISIVVTAGNGTTTRNYTVTVTRAAPPPTPTITLAPAPGPLPGATVGTSYSQAFTASGGSGPYTFASTGTLPSGLTLASNGTLSGTPTSAGTFNFTVTATDSSTAPGPYSGSSSYSLTVVNPPSNNAALSNLTLSASTLDPGFTSGTTSYTASVPNSVSSLTVTPTVAEGTASVRVNGATTASGTPSGAIPLAVGANTISIVVTAGDGTTTRRYTVTVTRAVPPTSPTITLSPPSGALPGTTVGTSYSQTFTASGGSAPYTFAWTGGTLPGGLTLASNGTLSGTPTSAGTFNFTVAATDSSTSPGPYSGSIAYALTVANSPSNNTALSNLTLSAGTLSPSFNGTITSYTASVPNGVATLTVTPTVAEGTASVRVNGAPTASGTPSSAIPLAVGANTISIIATAGDGTSVRTTLLTVTRAPVVTPTITVSPAALADGTVGTAYTQTLTAAGGTGPYRFALSGGALPAGLALDANGVVSGTPTGAGTFAFTVTATDRDGFAGQGAQVLRIGVARPTAQDRTLSVVAGASATVDLTEGASGGPFTGATIVGAPDSALGTAAIQGRDGGFTLLFQTRPTARGTVAVSFTLANAAGASAPATITFVIQPRPDPTRDAEVVGLIRAQAESARRTADGQIRNFRDRLERTHDEATRQAGSPALSIGLLNDPVDPLAYFETATDPSASGAAGALRVPADPARFGPPVETARRRVGNAMVWTGGFVNFASNDATGLDLDQTLIGVSAGVDYRFSPSFVGGVGVGYGRDRSDIGTHGTQTHTYAYSGALYGSYAAAPGLFLDGLVGYGSLDFASRRFATGSGAFAEGERSGSQVFGSLTATYELRSERMLFAPYLGLQGARTALDAFTESGAGSGNLAFGDQTVSTFAGFVGLRAEVSIPFDGGALIPRGRLEYGHDFAGASRVALGYADGGSLPFALSDDALSRDRLNLGVGLDVRFDDGWSLALDYQPGLGLDSDTKEQTITAKVSTRF